MKNEAWLDFENCYKNGVCQQIQFKEIPITELEFKAFKTMKCRNDEKLDISLLDYFNMSLKLKRQTWENK